MSDDLSTPAYPQEGFILAPADEIDTGSSLQSSYSFSGPFGGNTDVDAIYIALIPTPEPAEAGLVVGAPAVPMARATCARGVENGSEQGAPAAVSSAIRRVLRPVKSSVQNG